ncbi:MAG: cytochrome C [Myxococcaceae bacterium]
MRKIHLGGVAGAVGLVIVAVGFRAPPVRAGAESEFDEQHESRVRQGLEIAPVPLNFKGKNRELVGLGSYLVNAIGGCNDCHTFPNWAPGHNPYIPGQQQQVNVAVYLAGGRTFATPIGTFVSRNITPDSAGRPAGLTLDGFRFVLTTGHDPDEPAYEFQVMPWPSFRLMTDHDIRAIYEYLSAIPSLPSNPPAP